MSEGSSLFSFPSGDLMVSGLPQERWELLGDTRGLPQSASSHTSIYTPKPPPHILLLGPGSLTQSHPVSPSEGKSSSQGGRGRSDVMQEQSAGWPIRVKQSSEGGREEAEVGWLGGEEGRG